MRKSDFIFRYRVRNWPRYNRALVTRGSITFWIDEDAVRSSCHPKVPGVRGRPPVYTDTAIESALIVKAVFHLSLRVTQGFLESVVKLMRVELPVPYYTTVCTRQRALDVKVQETDVDGPRHVVVDTTGLKVFGAGEWYVRKHGMGRGRRRIWRKLHLGVDETTKEIVAVDLTSSRVHDSPHLPAVLDQVSGDVAQVSGDRGYDSVPALCSALSAPCCTRCHLNLAVTGDRVGLEANETQDVPFLARLRARSDEDRTCPQRRRRSMMSPPSNAPLSSESNCPRERTPARVAAANPASHVWVRELRAIATGQIGAIYLN